MKTITASSASLCQIVQMNNYFGLGIDAELSLDFHQAREDEPDKFTSRYLRPPRVVFETGNLPFQVGVRHDNEASSVFMSCR